MSTRRHRALDLDLDRVRVRTRARNLALDHALAYALDLERSLSLEQARALERALDRARILDRDLADALAHACALAHALASHLDPARSRNRHAQQLEGTTGALAIQAASIVQMLWTLDRDPVLGGASYSVAVVVSRAARRVVDITAQLLPVEHRANKSEEFAGELYEIAAAGGSRRRQLAHALRVLVYILPLRRALSGSRRRAVDRG